MVIAVSKLDVARMPHGSLPAGIAVASSSALDCRVTAKRLYQMARKFSLDRHGNFQQENKPTVFFNVGIVWNGCRGIA
jgi:hypothetical protein